MFDRIRRPRSVGQGPVDIGRSRTADLLRIIKEGWQRSLATRSVDPKMSEVHVTKHLLNGMRGAINDRVVRSSKKITVLRGTESWPDENSSRPAGLTDISIFLRDVRDKLNEHDPHVVVECKRVSGRDAGLCRQYVVDGIDRFIGQKYSSNHAVALMAGYLLTPDAESAAAGINRYLSGRGRIEDHLKSCTVLNEAWAKSSHHSRPKSGMPIDLHHAFLDFPQS